ncbi:fms-related tyrosine kinase 3 ligand isoform X2 [Pleurodeles waltl]|uniref:fms-related tyrosine kinase 3 ligand isoform X2 n=1 Tax=Pleurodeles waltl TaxID=8319 RepID=UPI003709AC16
MNWRHASQYTLSYTYFVRLRRLRVDVFMLLFITASGLSCNFSKYPLMSTVYEDRIETLCDYLPLDYPVSVITNLKMDNWCLELWSLYFMKKELDRMVTIAGKKLRPVIENITKNELFLFQHCNFTESPACQTYQHINVSEFLQMLSRQMKSLEPKILNDFSNCSMILCLPDSAGTGGAPSQETSNTSFATVMEPSTVPYSKYTITSETHIPLPQAKSNTDPKENKRVRVWILAPVCCTVVLALFIGCNVLRSWNEQDSHLSKDPSSDPTLASGV